MLAHLHHGKRVRPNHHHWARDAVIAAQVGAAALVVVTALEQARGDGGPPAVDRTELAVEAAPATGAGGAQGAHVAAAAQPTGDLAVATTAAPAGVAAEAPAQPAVELRGAEAAVDPPPAGSGPDGPVAAAPPVAEVVPATVDAPAAPAVAAPGHIELALLHGDGTTAPLPTPGSPLLGPLSVRVLDAGGDTVATAEVAVGEVGRIEGLGAGSYRLVLSTQTGVTEPSPGVAISAANTQVTDLLTITAGDVLLVAAQANPLPV